MFGDENACDCDSFFRNLPRDLESESVHKRGLDERHNVHRAMQEDMVIIVLNPNVNSYFDEETSERKPIPYNDTPEKHVLYVVNAAV